MADDLLNAPRPDAARSSGRIGDRLGRLAQRLSNPVEPRTALLVLAGAIAGLVVVVLIGSALVGAVPAAPHLSVAAPSRAAEGTSSPDGPATRPGPGGLTSSGVARTPLPPVDVPALHATAEALFTRTPGARPPATAIPPPVKPPAAPVAAPPTRAAVTPPPGPAPKPAEVAAAPVVEPPAGVPSKPESAPHAAASPPIPPSGEHPPPPAAPGERPESPGPDAAPPPTPVTQGTPVAPEPTAVPTWTPTTTRSPTETPTPTQTETATATPGPCEARVTVPRLAPANGFYQTIQHEGTGALAIAWPVQGGQVLVYRQRPPMFGADPSGIVSGVPVSVTEMQGAAGRAALTLPSREPGQYTVYFYNASSNAVGPNEATLVYYTIAHCP